MCAIWRSPAIRQIDGYAQIRRGRLGNLIILPPPQVLPPVASLPQSLDSAWVQSLDFCPLSVRFCATRRMGPVEIEAVRIADVARLKGPALRQLRGRPRSSPIEEVAATLARRYRTIIVRLTPLWPTHRRHVTQPQQGSKAIGYRKLSPECVTQRRVRWGARRRAGFACNFSGTWHESLA
jgi:hypothetical protein